MAIPKTIHYCWVGGDPKPQSVLYCIESWRKFCPDYEIREWNETNYDFTKNEYMRQAYEAKKWGFVPDYARLDIVYAHGGIYLDTDVELLRSLDSLLDDPCFFGFENTGDGEFFVNCGQGFGAEPGNPVIRSLRDQYDGLAFRREDGSLNLLASPHYTTQVLCQFGLVQEDRDQVLPGLRVYASQVLCPKNFRTGVLHRTKRTLSIHHFQASWVDEQIKKELAHQQKVKQRWGQRLGGFVLYGESVIRKYTQEESPVELPRRLLAKGKAGLIQVKDALPRYAALARAGLTPAGTGPAVLLDTALDSDNAGDRIIMECCLKALGPCFSGEDPAHVPTHREPTPAEAALLARSGRKLLCGTNILSGHMAQYGLWKMGPDLGLYKNTVLMGVGFDSNSEAFDRYSQMLLKTVLDKKALHSVRDSFSERKLRSMGISNVVNTGCPTMWDLTPEHCAGIPVEKGRRVVCTLTDYCRDPENDKKMLDILLESYEQVSVWLQGREDGAYLESLGYGSSLMRIPRDLAAYDRALEDRELDYVGTRLHAGIRALQRGRRTLVISIDNRASSIAADTGLPVLPREHIPLALNNRLQVEIKTNIALPWENIARWKAQFE